MLPWEGSELTASPMEHILFIVVGDKGLEPLNLSMLAPKASVFANFTNLPGITS